MTVRLEPLKAKEAKTLQAYVIIDLPHFSSTAVVSQLCDIKLDYELHVYNVQHLVAA